jgi:hypothetical protein
MDVTLVTGTDNSDHDPDEPLLLAALEAVGLRARVCAWNDATVDWSETPLTVIRSTWDYHREVDAFLDWCERTSRVTRLENPADVVAANAHKRYLADLTNIGMPVVPTIIVPRGTVDVSIPVDWHNIIVKPAVSGGSWRTTLHDDRASTNAAIAALTAERDALIQPYMRIVEGRGERSLMFVDGEFTHAVRKERRLATDEEAVSPGPVDVRSDELDLARQILDNVVPTTRREPLLYARVDLIDDEAGQPLLMELELIEPSLFLEQHPPALSAFAAAIARRAAA